MPPATIPARAARRAVSQGRVASAAATDRGCPLPDTARRRARGDAGRAGGRARPPSSEGAPGADEPRPRPAAPALARSPCGRPRRRAVRARARGDAADQCETTKTIDERTDAQVFVVADVSRSMLASSRAGSSTRLERVQAEADELRARLPGVPVGILSLTDRAPAAPLPDRRRSGLSLDAREVDRDREAAARRFSSRPAPPS